jgi:SMC interacting uncharacterized protein involved in chromosome segregation
MKYFFTAVILLFSFTACQDKKSDAKIQAEHDAKIRAEERAKVLAEFNTKKAEDAQKPKSTLSQLGIDIQDESITIDKNQSKQFFNELKDKIRTQIQDISDDISTGIEKTTEAGISMTKEHIDMDKTKELLKTWNKKIEDFVHEFDTKTDSNISKGK